MYKIGKENVEKIVIDKCQWGYEEYKPLTTLELSYDDEGFNVLFNMGNNVIIELVGKGFDGHEVTQGLAN